MIRWEYKSYLFEPQEKVLEKLNSLGRDGWEVIEFMRSTQDRMRVFFKRPIEPPQEQPK